MTLDPKAVQLINFAGRDVAEKGIKEIVKIRKKLDTGLNKYCNVLGEEITIMCPENLQRHLISFEKGVKTPASDKIKLTFGKINSVKIKAIRDFIQYNDAIIESDDGFLLNIKQLPDNEVFLLEIEYNIEEPRFIEALVNRKVASDIPISKEKNGIIEYWLSAQLKHPKLLKQQYYSLNIQDLDLDVDVGVGQDIKMKVPGIFKKQMEAYARLSKPMGRGEAFKSTMRFQQLSKGKYSGDHVDILKSIQDIFTESEFKNYIEITKDFRYHQCMRGTDYFDRLPIHTWPKFMTVVSRTELNLNKVVAEGELVYKKRDLISEIAKIFDLKD